MTLYRYSWRNNSKRATLYGRLCTVLLKLSHNSCVVRFEDNGQEEVVSRRALRRVKDGLRD